MSIDLLLVERGDGGDLVLPDGANDFVTIEGLQNMVYLALFGGNIAGSTKDVVPGEQSKDWWGNRTFLEENPQQQLNSLTETTLNEIALTSQGRLVLEQSVLSDLEFMTSFAEVSALVSFIGVDRVSIMVTLIQPDNRGESSFTFIWDATRLELEGPNYYETI